MSIATIERPLVPQFASAAELESAILEIGEGMRAIARTRIKRDTLILLLHDKTKISKRNIGYVLNALDGLEASYLKPVLIKR